MDDVQLQDLHEPDAALAPEAGLLDAVALEGPRSEQIAHSALGDVLPEPAPYCHRETQGIRILRCTLSGQPGLWFFCPSGRKRDLAAKLEAAGAVAASPDDLRVVRVENRCPRFPDDYSSSNIPHETGLLQAVSFSKGCYLGQEIVERVRARGQVNKLLVSLEFDTTNPLEAGTTVDHAGQHVGQLSSPVFSPRRRMVLAFAIVRREAAAQGAAVTAGGVPGRVVALP
jgi:folate-binding protein YgfZ